jgi:hypothetical protein
MAWYLVKHRANFIGWRTPIRRELKTDAGVDVGSVDNHGICYEGKDEKRLAETRKGFRLNSKNSICCGNFTHLNAAVWMQSC